LLPRLVKKGYDITFITGSASKRLVEAGGVRHVSLQGAADYDATDINRAFPDRKGLKPGPELLDFDFRKLFIGPMKDQARTIQAVLNERGDPAVLITNHMFTGSWPFQLQMPGVRPIGLVTLGITPMMLSGGNLAPFGLGLPPATTESERSHYAQLRQVFEMHLQGSKAALDTGLRQLGARSSAYSFLDATTLLPDIFLQMTIPGLEYARDTFASSVQLIGAAPGSQQAYRMPQWWGEIEIARRAGRPVIFVTQGTVARNLDALVHPTLQALAGTNALIIATAGKAGESISGQIPLNARLVDYLPYEQILPLADVMITNGGYGGVQQALRYGVPLIVAGTSEDKAEVAARVAWSGAGINLSTDYPCAEEITNAVSCILEHKHFKQAALRLSKEYDGLDPAAALEHAITSFAIKNQSAYCYS
jgi:UDP:flavonoid glycosyltransferase YjiC (YdhE family)